MPRRRPHPTLVVPFVVRALLLGAGVAGCATPPPIPGVPSPPVATPGSTDSLDGPWLLRASPGERAYTVTLASVLVSRIDTLTRTDTLRARLRAAMSHVAGGGPDRIAGLLLEYTTSSGDSVPFAALPGVPLPIPFSAALGARGSQPEWRTPAGDRCSPADAMTQPLRDLWVGAPARLTPGLEWQDSATYTICRDSIALAVRSERRFRVVGAEVRAGELVVRIERESQTRLEGEGAQFGEPLRIEADGSAHLQLLVSPAGGEVVYGEGEAEVLMAMTGRRRNQALRQVTRILIASP